MAEGLHHRAGRGDAVEAPCAHRDNDNNNRHNNDNSNDDNSNDKTY